MKRKSLLVVGITLVPLVVLALGVGAALVSHRPVEVGLVDGRLRPCPSSPNCVSSEPADAASVPALTFAGDPTLAFRSLVDFLGAESNAEILDVGDGYIHVVYYTRFMKFADDVEFRLDSQAKLIHVRSASRIGHSDLGTNLARVEKIRRHWTPPI